MNGFKSTKQLVDSSARTFGQLGTALTDPNVSACFNFVFNWSLIKFIERKSTKFFGLKQFRIVHSK
jgi:hypothetical protein